MFLIFSMHRGTVFSNELEAEAVSSFLGISYQASTAHLGQYFVTQPLAIRLKHTGIKREDFICLSRVLCPSATPVVMGQSWDRFSYLYPKQTLQMLSSSLTFASEDGTGWDRAFHAKWDTCWMTEAICQFENQNAPLSMEKCSHFKAR